MTDLLDLWRAEEVPQPEGWDFSSLADRMTESTEPWDLAIEFRRVIAARHHVLDMGTGGGEYLSTFAALLPPDTTATEAWPPNVRVATANLAPLGIEVVEYGAPDDNVDSVRMPFPHNRFDLVLNRHEAYSPAELARVIQPGGVFLTQQVGGDECDELDPLFGAKRLTLPHVNHNDFVADLEQVGFEVVDGADHVGTYTFRDVAAVIAYWQFVPWQVPADFTVDRYVAQLRRLHDQSGCGPIRLTRKRFWIKAVRR